MDCRSLLPSGVECCRNLWGGFLWASGTSFFVPFWDAGGFMDPGISSGWPGVLLFWSSFMLRISDVVWRNLFLEKEERREVG